MKKGRFVMRQECSKHNRLVPKIVWLGLFIIFAGLITSRPAVAYYSDRVPAYAKTMTSKFCAAGRWRRQSVAWLELDNPIPNSAMTDGTSVGVHMYVSDYVCHYGDGGGGAGTVKSGHWPLGSIYTLGGNQSSSSCTGSDACYEYGYDTSSYFNMGGWVTNTRWQLNTNDSSNYGRYAQPAVTDVQMYFTPKTFRQYCVLGDIPDGVSVSCNQVGGESFYVVKTGYVRYISGYPGKCTNAKTQQMVISFDMPDPKITVAPSGESSADKASASLGTTITFTHKVGATAGIAGVSSGSADVNFTFVNGSSATVPSISNPASGTSVTVGVGNPSAKKTVTEKHTVVAADLGKKVCRKINYSYKDPASNEDMSGSFSEVCVNIPKPTISISPSASTAATTPESDPAPCRKVDFKHTIGGSATVTNGPYTSETTIAYKTVAGPNNQVAMTGSKTKTIKVRTDGTFDPTSSTINEEYQPAVGDIGKKLCRRVQWSYTIDNKTTTNYGEEKCITIAAPDCNVTITSEVKAVPNQSSTTTNVIVNNIDMTDLKGTFTHTFNYNVASGNCRISPATYKGSFNNETFQTFGYGTSPQVLLPRTGKDTKTYTRKDRGNFTQGTAKGATYCESNSATSTNFCTQKAGPSSTGAAACLTADRLDYAMELKTTPTSKVAGLNSSVSFSHKLNSNQRVTDTVSVTIQQKIININSPDNASGTVTDVFHYPSIRAGDYDKIKGSNRNHTWGESLVNGKVILATVNCPGTTTGGPTDRNYDYCYKNNITGKNERYKGIVGKKICQRIVTKQLQSLGNGNGNKEGEWQCTSIPHEYELTPTVTINGSSGGGSVVPGEQHPVEGRVENTSASSHTVGSYSLPTQWQLVTFELQPDQQLSGSIAAMAENHNTPCNHFGNGCQIREQGNNRVFYDRLTQKVGTYIIDIPETAPIGRKYCAALSVQPFRSYWNNTNGTQEVDTRWRHARPICVVVSKRPITQVHGAGLILPNGSTKGSITVRPSDSTQYGSWMEYDILSGNLTTPADEFVASNAGHLINLGTASKDKWHQLTFANTPIYGKFGTNLPANRAQSLFSYYSGIAKTSANTIAKPAGDVVLHNLSYPSTIHYMSNIGGTLTLSGQLPNHKSLIVIQDGGNVVINGNITYQNQGGFSKASDFSQLIIIVRNGNIIINENVTQVDAWLVATGNNPNRGRLKTCNKTDDKVSMHDCVELLTVNGPVIVDYVDLLRTRGNDIANNTLGQPAEVFNFRPDSYLWAIGRSPELPVFETTHTKDLPPRY